MPTDTGLIGAESADRLIAWFAAEGRDLPWRHSRDAWEILVAEVMLQQTQAARVVPRWHELLAAFPDPPACAAAPVADVVRAWAGLGYNRRAVALHRAATAVTNHHGGRLPDTLAGLTALPGVGPYTGRAVLAFAFEHDDVGVLDTNASRVLSRVAGRRVTQAEADAAVPPGQGWVWNQAVIELGAAVCTSTPSCDRCPVRRECAWRGGNGPGGSEDPWVRGPAQSRFKGSDRQGRGRLIDTLGHGPVSDTDLAAVMGWPDDEGRARRVAETLVADGLVVHRACTWRLG